MRGRHVYRSKFVSRCDLSTENMDLPSEAESSELSLPKECGNEVCVVVGKVWTNSGEVVC